MFTHKSTLFLYEVPWTGFRACSSPKNTHSLLLVGNLYTCAYISSRFSVIINIPHSSHRHTPVRFLLFNHSSLLFKGTSFLFTWIYVNIYVGANLPMSTQMPRLCVFAYVSDNLNIILEWHIENNIKWRKNKQILENTLLYSVVRNSWERWYLPCEPFVLQCWQKKIDRCAFVTLKWGNVDKLVLIQYWTPLQ